MAETLDINVYGIAFVGKDDRICINSDGYGILYPDRSWQSIHQGFCHITGMKDFGTYRFGVGTMIKSDGDFTDAMMSAIRVKLEGYKKMQRHHNFEVVDITSEVYGILKVIVVDECILIDVFGCIDGKLLYVSPKQIDLSSLPASQNGMAYQFNHYAANLPKYVPVAKIKCLIVADHQGRMRVAGSLYGSYKTVPDKYITPDIVPGEYVVTGIRTTDKLDLCIVEHVEYKDVVDLDLVELLGRERGCGVCRAIGHINDPNYGLFGVILSVASDRSLKIDEIFGYDENSHLVSMKYNFDLKEHLLEMPVERVKYLGRSDMALGTWSLNNSIDEDLFYFDSLTDFDIRISGASYYVSNAYYGELVDKAIAMNIVECTCINDNIEIIDVRWDDINALNMFTGGEIRALADIISDVNGKAIEKVKSLSRKGKIKIDVK